MKIIKAFTMAAIAVCLFFAPLKTGAQNTDGLISAINAISGLTATPDIASPNTTIVTVTGTATNNATLTLNIPTGVKVLWKAELTGSTSRYSPLLNITGGSIDVTVGGKIEQRGLDKAIITSGNVTVSGGVVSAINDITIYAIGASSTITVSGGIVSSVDLAIYATGAGSAVTVSGDAIVQATKERGWAISISYGNVEVKDNARISAPGGAIAAYGESSTVTVCGNAIVQATGEMTDYGGYIGEAIAAYGNVEVKDHATVNTSIYGKAICTYGLTSSIIVSGGVVSVANGIAIETEGTGSMIVVSGKSEVKAIGDYNYAIHARGNVEVKEDATVSATTCYAIYADGVGSTITVSGGLVTNSATSTNYPVIYFSKYNNQSLNVMLNGTGKVQATGNGYAIHTLGSVKVEEDAEVSATTGKTIVAGGTVNVNGGVVCATTGIAIYVTSTDSRINITGGLVFAYGSSIADVISNRYSVPDVSGAGVVIAWNQAVGKTEYFINTDTDLISLPSGCAVWNILNDISGITYTNNSHTGFFALTDVTVTENTTTTGTASPYEMNVLKAWIQNRTLHMSGLTEGKIWSVYNILGTLIYRGIASSDEVEISLNVQGMYIVQSENRTIKVSNF